MKKLPAVVLEDMEKVMDEVTKQLCPLLSAETSIEEQRAATAFVGTLSALTLRIFDYLPPEQQHEILTTCGTWLDIGILLGKSPKLLVEILNKVNPKVENVDIPDWLADKLRSK
ncbi:hypothetical protein ES703_59947 [subsurface metagenome]